MVFKFCIALFHLPFFLEIDEGCGCNITDLLCMALPYIDLKNRIILPFSESRNSLSDRLVVYICGQQSDTK